jgi:ATP-dependent exoDNAse (exonuclease V) beta subunit
LNLGGTFKLSTNNKTIPRESGIYPELLMHRISEDGKLRIAGQADLIIIDGDDIHILDYKTNREIKKSSYYNSSTRQKQMMQYPVNNLQDCNLSHYNLQLSLYAWMLKKAHPELTVKSLTIIHIDHKDKTTFYDLPYLEKDVERMLAYYKGKILKDELYAKLKPIQY